MSVYGKAYELARALEKSDEYTNFKKCKDRLQSSEKNYEIYKDFCRQQWEFQLKVQTGEKIDEDQKKSLEEKLKMLTLNPTINDYINAEYRLITLIKDIQKIILKAIPEWTENNILSDFDSSTQK